MGDRQSGILDSLEDRKDRRQAAPGDRKPGRQEAWETGKVRDGQGGRQLIRDRQERKHTVWKTGRTGNLGDRKSETRTGWETGSPGGQEE